MTLEEQVAHYAAVRKRIAGAANKPKPVAGAANKPKPVAGAANKPKPVVAPPAPKRELSPEEYARSLTAGSGLPDRVKDIVRPILVEHRISWSQLWTPSRLGHLHRPRRLVWQALVNAGLSLAQTGRLTGRDHTSVIHGLRALNGTLRPRHLGRARDDARGLCAGLADGAGDQARDAGDAELAGDAALRAREFGSDCHENCAHL